MSLATSAQPTNAEVSGYPMVPKKLFNRKINDTERFNLAKDFVCQLASFPNCCQKTKIVKKCSPSLFLKCSCLHSLRDNDTVLTNVARDITATLILRKEERDTQLVSNIKYANLIHGKNSKAKRFLLPQRAGFIRKADLDTAVPTTQHVVCQSSLMSLYGVGPDAWATLNRSATTGIVIVHGLKGKPANNSLKPAIRESLHDFLQDLSHHAAPRATLLVRKKTEIVQKNDDDEIIELPTHWTKRGVWARWLDELGYDVTTNNLGTVSVTAKEGTELGGLPKYCCLKTFNNYWKQYFPKMILSKAPTDVCDDCFALANAITDESKKPDDADDDVPLTEILENEQKYLDRLDKARNHVLNSQKQRELFNNIIEQAKEARRNDVPWEDRVWTYVVDYAANLGLPWFGGQQPGSTYYYSPVNVFCFGMVDPSDPSPDPKDHLHAHMYTEATGTKGWNNVASLIMKQLLADGLLREDQIGGVLNFGLDNCGGHNKNRMVLRFGMYLAECQYFQDVNFSFLVRGHTKQNCDRCFNKMKKDYHFSNVFTYEQLVECLSGIDRTIHEVQDGDFEDWDSFLNEFYENMPSGHVRCNHIFSVSSANPTVMKISIADGESVSEFDLKKKGNERTRAERVTVMKAYTRKTLHPPGLRPIKRVEMAKYVRHVPEEYHTDDMYRAPTQSEILETKREKLEKQEAKAAKKRATRKSPRKLKTPTQIKPAKKKPRSLF